MNLDEKIELLQKINTNRILKVGLFCDILEQCGDLKNNYPDYMLTHPVDCDMELLRLPKAHYNLCCALLTMLLREDYFKNGSFEERQRNGQADEAKLPQKALLYSAIPM